MNFELNDDERLIQAEARRLFRNQCTAADVRGVLDGKAPFHRALWKQLAELGYLAAGVAEDHGGVGLGLLERCLIAEEAGRVLAPIPLLSLWAACDVLTLFGSDAQARRWMPELLGGAKLASCAVFGDTGASRAKSLVYEGGVLTGTVELVADAAFADIAIVAADGGALFMVDLNQPRVEREPVALIDPTRPHAHLRLHGAAAERIGAADVAAARIEEIAEVVRDRYAVVLGFMQLGGADAALESALEYARQRSTFGSAIGSYQAIKHKLVEVWIKNQIARGHCYYGAWALSTGAPELAAAAAGAHLASTAAFSLAAQENLQTHGGIGFTWEADCHLFYRRARYCAVSLGPLLDWKRRYLALARMEQAHLRRAA